MVAARVGEEDVSKAEVVGWVTTDTAGGAVLGGEVVITNVGVVKEVEPIDTDELDGPEIIAGVKTTAVLSPGMLKVI